MADRELTHKINESLDSVNKQEVQDRLRLIAYSIWEEQGKPDGRAEDHWYEAERRARSGGDVGLRNEVLQQKA